MHCYLFGVFQMPRKINWIKPGHLSSNAPSNAVQCEHIYTWKSVSVSLQFSFLHRTPSLEGNRNSFANFPSEFLSDINYIRRCLWEWSVFASFSTCRKESEMTGFERKTVNHLLKAKVSQRLWSHQVVAQPDEVMSFVDRLLKLHRIFSPMESLHEWRSAYKNTRFILATSNQRLYWNFSLQKMYQIINFSCVFMDKNK